MKINMTEQKTQQSYESPAIAIVIIESEGVLCASGQNEEWYEETLQ